MGRLQVKAPWKHHNMVDTREVRIRLAFVCFYLLGTNQDPRKTTFILFRLLVVKFNAHSKKVGIQT